MYVSLSVQALYFELVFIACCLRCYISQTENTTLLWSSHSTNFVSDASEIKKLKSQLIQGEISKFFSVQSIQWLFILKHALHLWWAVRKAVKSFKYYLHQVIGNVKLTFLKILQIKLVSTIFLLYFSLSLMIE